MSVLPALPTDWKAAENFSAISAFSSPVKRQIEPVGPGFLAHARRTLRGRTWSEDEKIQAEQNVKKVEEVSEADLLEEEPEDPALFKLDPKKWKEQDHYEVLGITKLRYKATEEQIRVEQDLVLTGTYLEQLVVGGLLGEGLGLVGLKNNFETSVSILGKKREKTDSIEQYNQAKVHTAVWNS